MGEKEIKEINYNVERIKYRLEDISDKIKNSNSMLLIIIASLFAILIVALFSMAEKAEEKEEPLYITTGTVEDFRDEYSIILDGKLIDRICSADVIKLRAGDRVGIRESGGLGCTYRADILEPIEKETKKTEWVETIPRHLNLTYDNMEKNFEKCGVFYCDT